jgi:hypothetical protein
MNLARARAFAVFISGHHSTSFKLDSRGLLPQREEEASRRFAQSLWRVPDYPYSFYNGLAGAAHFLLDAVSSQESRIVGFPGFNL